MANLHLFWDGGDPPAGWSLVSESGGAFYHKFVRGAAAYDAVGGGAATHTHTLGLVSCTGASAERALNSQYNVVSTSHTHTLNTVACGTGSNLPAYKSLKVIKCATGVPASLPQGIIALFDVAIPGAWTRQADIDAKFIYCSDAVGFAGSDTHAHTISGETDYFDEDVLAAYDPGSTASMEHYHNVNVNTPSHDNVPTYKTVVFGKKDGAGAIPLGLIGMFDGDPGEDWEIISGVGEALNHLFIRGSDTYGGTGGVNTHTPNNQIFTTAGEAIYPTRSLPGAGASKKEHTHDMTVSFTQGDNTPPYIDVIFAKNLVSPPPAVGWRKIAFEIEPPTPGWNQLKREAGTGWCKILYEGE